MYSLVHMKDAKHHPRIDPLIQWLKKTPEAEARARCIAHDTTWDYLRQIAYGYKLVGPRKGVAIERITGVPRQLMRPKDYWHCWPDLPIPCDAGEESGLAKVR